MRYIRQQPNNKYITNITVYPGKNNTSHGTAVTVGTYSTFEKAEQAVNKAIAATYSKCLTYEEKRAIITNIRKTEMAKDKGICCGITRQNKWNFCPICAKSYDKHQSK